MAAGEPGRGALPPAFRLACACCAWPPSAERDAAVRDAAAGADWARLRRVVARQRIPGLAAQALAGVAPPETQARLARLASASADRSRALATESLRLLRRFDAEGQPLLFLKGAALGQLAYGDPSLKHGRDIDILVSPADAERAFQLLRAEGYQVIAPAGDLDAGQRRTLYRLHKDMELFHPERRLNLELHWRLVDNPVLLPGVGVGSPTQTVSIGDGALPTLADEALFAYLVLHGASHAWFRLKWLADLNAWLAGKSLADIASLRSSADRLGVGDCAEAALWLRGQLLGGSTAPAPRGWRVRRLAAGALDAMIGPDGETELAVRPFGGFRLLPAQFLRARGAAFLWAQGRLLFSSLDDRLAVPLPAALGFLYPLLRLPLWLLRLVRRRRAAARGERGVAGA